VFAAALLLASLLASPVEPSTVEGYYFRGDGLGVNQALDLYANHRFGFLWRGCLGVYGRGSGTWSLSGDRLVLKDESRDESGDYRVVRWGPRVYLIPDESMIRFCEAIRQGGEPRNDSFGMFYLRQEDWEKPASGLPEVPAEFVRYLPKQAK